MRHIETQTCPTCNGTGETIHAGIRTDCKTCDGFKVLVHTYDTHELMLENFEDALIQISEHFHMAE